MTSRTTAFCIFCGLVLLAIAHVVYYYPLMPAMMASHFDFAGQANGWMDKSSFMGVYAATVGVIALIFFAMSLVMQKIPAWMMNLPNKDYWLAPERRDDTYRRLSASMMWIGNATLLFMIACMQITFRTNLQPAWNPSTAFLTTIGSFVAVVLAWTVVYLYSFRLPK